MKRAITISILIFIGFWQKATACSCFFIPTFCEAITYDNNGQIHDYLTIQRIKVLSLGNNGLNVGVTQTFFGENLEGQTLFLRDGDGANCNLFASLALEVGKEYVVASFGDSTEIVLSECYVSFLKVENGVVTGAIAPGVDQVDLADFPKLDNCGELNASGVNEVTQIGGIFKVQSTLTTSEVNITAKHLSKIHGNSLQVEVYDSMGRLVTRSNFANFGVNSTVSLDASTWGAGIYFLKMEAGNIRETVKLVKL